MSDDIKDCDNCINKLMFRKDMDHMAIAVGSNTDEIESLKQRMAKLERRSDVSDERFKQVFDKLDEIIEILKERENRIPNLFYSVAGMLTGGVASGVIMWLITR